MRRATRSRGPLFLITSYYALVLGAAWWARQQPEWAPMLPFGGIDHLADAGADSFEVVTSVVEAGIMDGFDSTRLALAMLGAVLLMIPVSWVYFITTRTRRVDQSFVQTILILPVLVAGIAVIVANSLALAFSLAGILLPYDSASRLRSPQTRFTSSSRSWSALARGSVPWALRS